MNVCDKSKHIVLLFARLKNISVGGITVVKLTNGSIIFEHLYKYKPTNKLFGSCAPVNNTLPHIFIVSPYLIFVGAGTPLKMSG